MKAAVIAAILLAAPMAGASAQAVPDWVRATAGFWADGKTSDKEFASAIAFLIKEGEITVGQVQAGQSDRPIPEWVKSTVSFWVDEKTSDAEFVNAIEYLIKEGSISVQQTPSQGGKAADIEAPLNGPPHDWFGQPSQGGKAAEIEAQLESCEQIKKASARINCKKAAEQMALEFKYDSKAEKYEIGPVTFYYIGPGFETTSSGKPLLTVKMLAKNTGSDSNVALSCTGPAICAYDIWDGESAFKYSGSDFTNGQIVLKPGAFREFSLLFGPNIGYGGTEFKYDESKQYDFRVQEPWGSASIPAGIGR